MLRSPLLLLALPLLASALATEELAEWEDGEARLLFSNFTSGLVAINTTLLTYAAVGVAGAAAVGLLLYLLATSSPNARYANAYNQYGDQGQGQGQYQYTNYNRRMFTDSAPAFNLDLLGLVSKAVQVYQRLNGEEEMSS